jgi:Dolichyl-phosphate-mannose-protein mannosyltransferase
VKPKSCLNTEKITRSLIARILFVLFAAIYLATASGYTLSDAGQLRVEVARAIVERGEVSVPADMGIRGRDGNYYSWFGIGPVLSALPLYCAGKATGTSPAFVISLLNQLVGAATVVLVFFFSSYLGFSNRSSLLTALFYGLGTMAWPYAKDSGDHALEALFVLLSLYFVYRHRQGHKNSDLMLSAFSFGFSLLIRPTSILVAPALAILLMYPQQTGAAAYKTAKKCLTYIVLLVPFIALILWYDNLRFGSVFETGYRLMATRLGVDYFSGTPLLAGLMGFLVSPGKGFFYFSPVAVLFFFVVRSFSKKYPLLSIAFILTALLYLVLYSKNIYWHGSNGWGPRYLFVITPFFIIPLAMFFDSTSWRDKHLLRKAVYLLFAVSFIIQIGAVTVSPYKYFVYLQTEKNVEFRVDEAPGVQPIIAPPAETYFDWRLSPVLAQFWFIDDVAVHLEAYRHHVPPKDAWMKMFDFWWLYDYVLNGNSADIIIVLLLIMLIFFCSIRLANLAK